MTSRAYLGLGSNLGDRLSHLEQAIHQLSAHAGNIEAISTLYETNPIEVNEPQPAYINAVVRIQTEHTATKLHSICLDIENQMGRRDKGLKKPRCIDIDLLLFNDLKFTSATLDIPHPRLLQRKFVLRPLKDVLTTGWPEDYADINHCCDTSVGDCHPIEANIVI